MAFIFSDIDHRYYFTYHVFVWILIHTYSTHYFATSKGTDELRKIVVVTLPKKN